MRLIFALLLITWTSRPALAQVDVGADLNQPVSHARVVLELREDWPVHDSDAEILKVERLRKRSDMFYLRLELRLKDQSTRTVDLPVSVLNARGISQREMVAYLRNPNFAVSLQIMKAWPESVVKDFAFHPSCDLDLSL